MAELLLDNGADATIPDNVSDWYFAKTDKVKINYLNIQDDETPLTLASELGHKALVDLIIRKTPAEKRKLLLDYKKKVRRNNFNNVKKAYPSLHFRAHGLPYYYLLNKVMTRLSSHF